MGLIDDDLGFHVLICLIPVWILLVLMGSGPDAARAQSPVSEIEDSGGNTLVTVFDNGQLEVTGGFLLPDGTLLDESSDLGSLSLPFSGTAAASNPLLAINQGGSGRAAEFDIFNTDNNAPALHARSAGGGPAVRGIQSGTGSAGSFQISNSSSAATALEVSTDGTGAAGLFSVISSSNGVDAIVANTNSDDGYAITATARGNSDFSNLGNAGKFQIQNSTSEAAGVYAATNGTGNAGFFGVNNTDSEAAALRATSDGTGPAFRGHQTGTGEAGFFEIDNSNSVNAALRAETNGGGIAGLFRIFNSNSDADVLRANTTGTGFVADLTAAQTGTGAGDNPAGNVARIANFGGQGADVLALQAGLSNPTDGVNYLSFYDENGSSVGAVEGNGSGGVRYKTSGSDYAEALPVAKGAHAPEPTDLVGVRGGAVSLATDGADRLMVVTDRAAVLGNATEGNASTRGETTRERVPVAFIGQVPVRLRGPAEVGDWIVASGRADGTARAIAPETYRRATHGPIAGQAWSAKSIGEIGTVTVAVGLGSSGALAGELQTQQDRLEEQQRQLSEQQNRITSLEAENAQIKKRLARLESASGRPSVLAQLPGLWILGASGMLLLLGAGLGAGLRRTAT
jgi:hypothetical protein